MTAHEEVSRCVATIDPVIRKGQLEVIVVTGSASGICATRNGFDIKLTPFQALTLAILTLHRDEPHIAVQEFCKRYYGGRQAEPDSFFDTPVRALKKVIPPLAWHADHGGNRKILGVDFRSDLSPRTLRAFIQASRTKKAKKRSP